MSDPVIALAIGLVDGARTDFQTPSVYFPGSLWAFLDGQLIHKDDDDGPIELGGTWVRMKRAPRLTSRVVFWYHERPPTSISYPCPPQFLSAFDLAPFIGISQDLEPIAFSAENTTVVPEEIMPDDFYAVLDLSPKRKMALDLVPVPYKSEVLEEETEPVPELVDLRFVGGYPSLPSAWGIPGNQTNLKAGDTFQLQFTADEFCIGARVLDQDACSLQTFTFDPTYSGLLTVTIADRGTTTQALPAWVQVCNVFGEFGTARATNHGGGTTDKVHVVYLNNAQPSGTFGVVDYPGSQLALKGSETATVSLAAQYYETILFTSPPAELLISNPSAFEATKTVQRIAGTTRFSGTNFQFYMRRLSNGTEATVSGLVEIANVAIASAVITLPAARLRSGGNDGTTAPVHSVTLTFDQPTLGAPSLDPATNGGTWNAAWSGGPSAWVRGLRVHDDDLHQVHSWTGFSVTNRAGLVTTSFSPATYTIGGFIARVVGPFAPFTATASIHVPVITYTKLAFGIFSLSGAQVLRNPVQGDHSNITNTVTVDSIGTPTTVVYINDPVVVGQNTLGNMTITGYVGVGTVGIEEIV